VRAVEPVHRESNITGKLELLEKRQLNLGVMENIVKRTTGHQLGNDGKLTRLCASSLFT
jgi:hypothetical protein